MNIINEINGVWKDLFCDILNIFFFWVGEQKEFVVNQDFNGGNIISDIVVVDVEIVRGFVVFEDGSEFFNFFVEGIMYCVG